MNRGVGVPWVSEVSSEGERSGGLTMVWIARSDVDVECSMNGDEEGVFVPVM